MTWLAVLLTVLTGGVVLLSWLFPLPFLEGWRWWLLYTGMVLSGLVFLAAFTFFLHTQWQAVRQQATYWPARALLIVAALSTFALTTLIGPQRLGPWLWRFVLVPGGSALLGLLAVVLTYRGLWMAWRRQDPWRWLFLLTFILAILLDAYRSLVTPPGWLTDIFTWWNGVVIRAGVRGLLLGLALGVILVGLRVLMGADRPYEG